MRTLRLSYLAGWGINSELADYLYRQMLRYRRPPTFFSGSPEQNRGDNGSPDDVT